MASRSCSRRWPHRPSALALQPPPAAEAPVAPAAAREVAETLAGALERLFVSPDVGRRYAAALRAHAAAGDYDALASRNALAEALTRDVQAVQAEGHFRVFPAAAAPAPPPRPRRPGRRSRRRGCSRGSSTSADHLRRLAGGARRGRALPRSGRSSGRTRPDLRHARASRRRSRRDGRDQPPHLRPADPPAGDGHPRRRGRPAPVPGKPDPAPHERARRDRPARALGSAAARRHRWRGRKSGCSSRASPSWPPSISRSRCSAPIARP